MTRIHIRFIEFKEPEGGLKIERGGMWSKRVKKKKRIVEVVALIGQPGTLITPDRVEPVVKSYLAANRASSTRPEDPRRSRGNSHEGRRSQKKMKKRGCRKKEQHVNGRSTESFRADEEAYAFRTGAKCMCSSRRWRENSRSLRSNHSINTSRTNLGPDGG